MLTALVAPPLLATLLGHDRWVGRRGRDIGRGFPSVSAGVSGAVAQPLGHLPVLELSDEVAHRVGMVVGQYPSGTRRELSDRIVY